MNIEAKIADQCESELLSKVEEYNKKLLNENIPQIKCPNCGETGSFKLTSYNTEGYKTTAYLTCTNCEFEGHNSAIGKPDFNMDNVKDDIKTGIKDLQSSINRLNRG